MTSESKPRGAAYWVQRAAELRAWEQANRDVATAWDAAFDEDDRRTIEATRRRNEREMIACCDTALRRMGVPSRYAEAVHGEMRLPEERRRHWNTLAMQAARDFVGSNKSLLLLYGGPGAGKSCAASWCLLRARSRKPYDEAEFELDPDKGLFVTASSVASVPRFDNGGTWDRLLSVRWLVLDEMAIDSGGDFWSERVNELLGTRYANKLRTIMTCNMSKTDFKARYGERIASRVRDDGVVAGCGDDDLRSRATEAA